MTDRPHTLDDAPRPRKAPEQSVRVPRDVRVGHSGTRQTAHAPGAAVVKVTNHRKGVREVVATLKYLLCKADRAEDDWARDVGTPAEIAKSWELKDNDGRSAAHVILSLPNKDPEAEWLAARDAAWQLFGNHPHVVALHTDTGNPHVHVVVRSRDYFGRKLRIDRDTLHDYRKALARAGREHGIAVEARRYEVPTRLRDRWRVFSTKEPIERRLDRHIAVLGRPAQATPSQLKDAYKALNRHHNELHDGQRRRLLRAATKLEGYPTLEKGAAKLTRIAFMGPRGDRYKPRHKQEKDLELLAKASPKTANLEKSDNHQPAKQPSARKSRRAVARTIKNIENLRQRQRDKLAASLGDLPHRQQVKLRKALERSKTPVERQRDKLARKQQQVAESMRILCKRSAEGAVYTALWSLGWNRKHLQAGDRLKLRELTFDTVKDPGARALCRTLAQKLAQRPRTIREHATAAARTVGSAAVGQAKKALAPNDAGPPRQERIIDEAIRRLNDRDAGPLAHQRALWALQRQKEHLTEPQRNQLQTFVDTTKRPDPSRPDVERHTPTTQAVTRVLAHRPNPHAGETRRFSPAQRQQSAIDHAIETLRTPPIPGDWAARRAVFNLRRHRDALTLAHRERLLECLTKWKRSPDENPALPRYIKAATRLIAHGEEGRAFVQHKRIATSLETLQRPTPRAEPSTPAEPVKEALVTLRKDVIALRAKERAQARRQAAAHAKQPDTGREANKLARALDRTMTVEEHAQKHLTRALKSLADLPNANLLARRHAKRALVKYHPFLTSKQARHLGELADGFTTRRPRLAKALRRLAQERSRSRAPGRSQ